MNDLYPLPLNKRKINKLRKQFPDIVKKRKKLKEYISALKNYDYVEKELWLTRNKLNDAKNKIKELEEEKHTLERANNNKMDKIFSLQQQIVDYEELYELKLKDLALIQNKLKETEERRRANAGKVGGLIASNKNLNNKVEMYKQIIDGKDRDLNQAVIIIKNLNKKINRLTNKPTFEEIKEYEKTGRLPKKR